MFAASPLFNNSEPYMRYTKTPTGLESEEHVWFGKEDPSLWNRCLEYCNDFFNDNAANGNYYALVMPTSQDEAGYRAAYRRAYRYRNDETHHEKLFDAHPTLTLSDGGWGWGWRGFALDCLRQGGADPTNELMECFGMQDGRNFPYSDIYGKKRPGVDIFADRDPRLYETMVVPRHDLPAGFDYNGANYNDPWVGGCLENNSNFNSNGDDVASGYAKFKWLLDYKGGSRYDDEYIGVAYIRLAEMYLIRAEANLFLGNIDAAFEDLYLWNEEHMSPNENDRYNHVSLTKDQILSFYGCYDDPDRKDPGYGIVMKFHIDEVCPSDKYHMTDEIEPYMQCVQHFRRIQLVHMGNRWFDIKRFGFSISHDMGISDTYTLEVLDPRYAIQIPNEVIGAGLEPNPRVTNRAENSYVVNSSENVRVSD